MKKELKNNFEVEKGIKCYIGTTRKNQGLRETIEMKILFFVTKQRPWVRKKSDATPILPARTHTHTHTHIIPLSFMVE